MVLVADDDVVNQLDLQQLTGATQIARHFDVGFRGRGFTARMIVLCEASSYVQLPFGSTYLGMVSKAKGVLCKIANHSGGLRHPSLFAS